MAIPRFSTTGLTSPALGTDDGGNRAIAGTFEAIAENVSAIARGIDAAKADTAAKQAAFDKAEKARLAKLQTAIDKADTVKGKAEATRVFNSVAAKTAIGSPISILDRDFDSAVEGLAYTQTLDLLTMTRATEDGTDVIAQISAEAESLPTEFDAKFEASLAGYLDAAPIESRDAIEMAWRRKANDARQKLSDELQVKDTKEAVSSATLGSDAMSEEMIIMITERGEDAFADPEFSAKMNDYIALQQIRVDGISHNFSQAQSDKEIGELRSSMITAASGFKVNSIYDQATAAGFPPVEAELIAKTAIEDLVGQAAINSDERDALRRSLTADITARSSLAKTNATIASSRVKETNSKKAAVLDVRIAAGEATQTEITTAFQNGWLTTSQWAAFSKRQIKQVEEQGNKADAGLFAQDVINGDAVFDPANTKQTKALDTAFDAELERATLEQSEQAKRLGLEAPAPDMSAPGITDWVVRTGHVPDKYGSHLNAMATNGTPDQQVQAVESAMMIQSESGNSAFGQLPKNIKDLTNYAGKLISAGVPPEEAVVSAHAALNVKDPVREARAKSLTSKRVDKAVKRGLKFTGASEKGVLLGDFTEYETDFEALYRDEFIKVGDTVSEDAIFSAVEADLSRVWGETKVGGSGGVHFQKYAPEAIYGVFEDTKRDAEWIGGQLQFELHSAISDIGAPIDITRPVIINEDGSISTEETITIERGGKFFNVPTVIDGERVDPDIVQAGFEAGDENIPHVGEFNTLKTAEDAAIRRSTQIPFARGLAIGTQEDLLADDPRIDTAFLSSDFATSKEAEGSKTYQVYYMDGEFPTPLIIDGEIVRFRPNYSTSPRGIANKLASDLSSANELAKAEKQQGDVDRRRGALLSAAERGDVFVPESAEKRLRSQTPVSGDN